jgi:hypothetical protein
MRPFKHFREYKTTQKLHVEYYIYLEFNEIFTVLIIIDANVAKNANYIQFHNNFSEAISYLWITKEANSRFNNFNF